MAKFKVGDYVRQSGDGLLSGDSPEAIITGIDGESIRHKHRKGSAGLEDAKYFKLIKKGDNMTIENANFALIYERDEDPVEYFKTEKQALKKIEELLEDSAVNRQSIYLVPLSGVRKVKVNNFSLEEV